MLASIPASTMNQKPADLGIPNRFKLKSSRFTVKFTVEAWASNLRRSLSASGALR
jgi:hypothetical protein